jgi:hypothetical protein
MDESSNRADVRTYGIILQFAFRFLPRKVLEKMYENVMVEAIEEYNTDIMSEKALDFRHIAESTVKIEREVMRRGLERKSLDKGGFRDVYATDIWGHLVNPPKTNLTKFYGTTNQLNREVDEWNRNREY